MFSMKAKILFIIILLMFLGSILFLIILEPNFYTIVAFMITMTLTVITGMLASVE